MPVIPTTTVPEPSIGQCQGAGPMPTPVFLGIPVLKDAKPRRVTMADILNVAKVCHAANMAYCQSLGDQSQLVWEYAPDWQKESAQNGVLHYLLHPMSQPQDSHESWLEQKRAEGWTYGETKDPVAKTHPCFLPYAELPEPQRLKDVLFIAICRALLGS
jgi:hypothetical protein